MKQKQITIKTLKIMKTKLQMAKEIAKLAVVSKESTDKVINAFLKMDRKQLEFRYNEIIDNGKWAWQAAYLVTCVSGITPNWVMALNNK